MTPLLASTGALAHVYTHRSKNKLKLNKNAKENKPVGQKGKSTVSVSAGRKELPRERPPHVRDRLACLC